MPEKMHKINSEISFLCWCSVKEKVVLCIYLVSITLLINYFWKSLDISLKYC